MVGNRAYGPFWPVGFESVFSAGQPANPGTNLSEATTADTGLRAEATAVHQKVLILTFLPDLKLDCP